MTRGQAEKREAVQIRDAHGQDLPAVLAIYNAAVLQTTAVWNDDPVDLANRRSWLQEREAQGFPVIVAVVDDAVRGFATFGNFRPWDGYKLTVEHSVYVHEAWRRRGLAHQLLKALIIRARQAGKHTMVAGIEGGNHASIALHRSLGFREAGRLHEVGAKFGRWLDLVFMEIRLDDRRSPGGVARAGIQ